MAVEEAGLVSAHVSVADGVAVDDLLLVHLLPHLGRLVLIDEVREAPVLLADFAVTCASRTEAGGHLDEGLVEVCVVEKDPVVVVETIEAILDLPYTPRDIPNVGVAGQCHEGRIHSLAGCLINQFLLVDELLLGRIGVR